MLATSRGSPSLPDRVQWQHRLLQPGDQRRADERRRNTDHPNLRGREIERRCPRR